MSALGQTNLIAGFRKQTWISVIICGLLLATYAGTRTSNIQAGQEPLLLSKIDPLTVDAVQVHGEKSFSLQKKDDSWFIKIDDALVPAVASEITSAIDNILDLKPGRLVTRRESKHADYGVDTEKGRRVELLSNGTVLRDLFIGSKSKSSGAYIRLHDSDRVYVADGQHGSAFSRDVNGYREKKVNAGLGDIVAVTSKDFAIQKSEDGFDVTPMGSNVPAVEIDTKRIEAFVEHLQDLKATDFAALSVINALEPLAELSIKSKTSLERTLKLYQLADERFVVSVHPFEYDFVYIVSEYEAKRLQKKYQSFEDHHLFKNQEATRIEISGNEQPLVLVKEANGWTISDDTKIPEGYDLDLSRAGNLAQDILKLEANKNMWDVSEHSNMVRKITVAVGDEVVHLGAVITKEGDLQNHRMLSRQRDQKMFGIASHNAKVVEKPFERLKKLTPPPGAGGMPGMQGMQGLPPELQQQLMRAMQQQGMQ